MRFLPLCAAVLLLSSCASSQAYREVMKDEPAVNTRSYQVAEDVLYPAVIETMMMKKFSIEKEDKANGLVTGKRFFNKGRRNTVLALQAKLISKGERQTALFLNAIQTTEKNYIADHTRFLLFVIPLPGGGGKEVSQLKEAEKVVDDKAFYNTLFDDIGAQLPAAEVEMPLAGEAAAGKPVQPRVAGTPSTGGSQAGEPDQPQVTGTPATGESKSRGPGQPQAAEPATL